MLTYADELFPRAGVRALNYRIDVNGGKLTYADVC
jgi:hypothetical protein